MIGGYRRAVVGCLLVGAFVFAAPAVAVAATSFFDPDVYSAGYTRDARVVDFDGDGHDDVLTLHGEKLTVWLGDGEGQFDVVDHSIAATLPLSMELADVDRDGALDVVTVDGMTGAAQLLRGDGDGGIAPPSSVTSNADPVLALGDFGGDDGLDVAMSRSLGVISLLIQQPDGSFAEGGQTRILTSPSDLVAADLDDDGYDDLAVRGSDGRIYTLLREGSASFEPYVIHDVGGTLSDMKVTDLGSDGDLDIVAGHYGGAGGLSVLTATAPGAWAVPVTHSVGLSSSRIAVDDLDGDGHVDVVVVPAAEDKPRALLQRAGGGFDSIEVGDFYVSGAAGEADLADFDEDGESDLVVAEFAGGLKVAFGDALNVAPPFIEFGVLEPGANVTSTFTVRNTGSGALAPGAAQLIGDAAPFSIAADGCRDRMLARRQTCEIAVRFLAPHATDYYSAAVAIPGGPSSGPRFVELDGGAWLPGSLVSEPGEIDFGYTRVGATSPPRIVQIANGGGTPVGVESVAATAGFTVSSDDCSGAVLYPEEGCSVTVAFRPRSATQLTGVLTVVGTGESGTAVTSLRGSTTASGRTTFPRQRTLPRSPVSPRPQRSRVEIELAEMADAVSRAVRGGPARELSLPPFKAESVGRLSLTLYGWKRSQRSRMGSGALNFGTARSGRLRFRLNRTGISLLRRPQRTRIKVVAKFEPLGSTVVFRQASEYMVKRPKMSKPKAKAPKAKESRAKKKQKRRPQGRRKL